MPKLPPPPRSPQNRSAFSVLAGGQEAAVGGDDVGREQVVAGQAVLALQPADAAAEREPGDAGRRDRAAGRRQPERLRLAVELAPGQAGLGARDPAPGIDPHALHPATGR